MHWLSFETKWVGIAPDKQFGTHEVKLLGEKQNRDVKEYVKFAITPFDLNCSCSARMLLCSITTLYYKMTCCCGGQFF